MRKIFSVFFLLLLLISTAVAGYTSYWMYTNKVYSVSRIAKPLEGAEIVKEGEATDGVEYGTGTALSSPEQVKNFRDDTSQPLYLRSYLAIPSIGVNQQIFEGTSNRALAYGIGTINEGQTLNKANNYAVAGHNYADWYYSNSFSKLQLYYESVVGKQGYISDGEYVYTYKFVDNKIVPREISRDYTDEKLSQEELADHIKEIGHGNETVKVEEDGKEVEKTIGRILTLYTCYEIPPDYYMSYDRIIIRGIQTDKMKLEDSPDNIKNLFLIDNSDNDSIGMKNVSELKDDNKIKSKNPIDHLLNQMLEVNSEIVFYLMIGSLILVVISIILLIILK